MTTVTRADLVAAQRQLAVMQDRVDSLNHVPSQFLGQGTLTDAIRDRDAAQATVTRIRVSLQPPNGGGIQGRIDALKVALDDRRNMPNTSLSRMEHADAEIEAKRNALKAAIRASGIPLEFVNAQIGRKLNNPVDRLLFAETTADLARENADAVAAKYGFTNMANLEGREPGNVHVGPGDRQLVSAQSAADTKAARKLEQMLQDQLIATADKAVADLRGQGLSRNQALEQLRRVAGLTGSEVLGEKTGVPNTLGMTTDEKAAIYEQKFLATASPEAKAAYTRGERVVLALRHDTPLWENRERGQFDDRWVVLQKRPDGSHFVKEFRACLDPNTRYGPPGDNNRFYVPADLKDAGPYNGPIHQEPVVLGRPRAWVNAPARVASGQTIRYQTGPDGLLYPPAGTGYRTQGDVNGDGLWNDNAFSTEYRNSYQIHNATTGHTGSAGCMTVPEYQWQDFRTTVLQNQPTIAADTGKIPNWVPFIGSATRREQTVYVTFA